MTRLAYEISERAMRSREGASGMSATAIRAVLDAHDALVRDCAEGRLTFGEFLGACGDFPRGYGLSGASEHRAQQNNEPLSVWAREFVDHPRNKLLY